MQIIIISWVCRRDVTLRLFIANESRSASKAFVTWNYFHSEARQAHFHLNLRTLRLLFSMCSWNEKKRSWIAFKVMQWGRFKISKERIKTHKKKKKNMKKVLVIYVAVLCLTAAYGLPHGGESCKCWTVECKKYFGH